MNKIVNKILILGASGMLGNTLFRFFLQDPNFNVLGTVRAEGPLDSTSDVFNPHLIYGLNIQKYDDLEEVIHDFSPNIVINCIGLVKQSDESNDPYLAISINALFPHKLAAICRSAKSRLIHISTDCVFSGKKGLYTEDDMPDANDLYGRTKYLGEVDSEDVITLRTSIIGHELSGRKSLLDWFLFQEGRVEGFKNAIFSGLSTVEIARVISDYVIPHKDLRGIYHVSASPICKFDLLVLVSQVFGKSIEILPNENFHIDRSLNSDRFCKATGYISPSWIDMIRGIHSFGR